MIEQTKEKLDKVLRVTKVTKNEFIRFADKFKKKKEAYDYLRGKQYTDEQIKYYDNLKRPTHVFNSIFEKFNYILGDSILSDHRQRVYPRANADPQIAEMWENHLDYIHQNNEYKLNIMKVLMAGWLDGGAAYLRWSNEKDIMGSLVYTDEDEFGLLWDSRAQHPLLDDAKYVIRNRWMTISDILNVEEWDTKDLKGVMDAVEKSEYTWETTQEANNASDVQFQDKKNGKYRVIEFHEIKRELTEVAYDPIRREAKILEFKHPERKDLFLRAHPDYIVTKKKARIKRILTVLPSFNWLLSDRKADTQDGTYDIIPYAAYPFAKYTVDFFGMIQIAKSPQDFLNDMENRKLDIINKTANAPTEIIKEAYNNPEDVINYANMPGLVMDKKAEFIGRETFKTYDPPKFPFAVDNMAQEAKEFLEMLTATNELVGREKDKGAPASLYAQKVAQGQIKFAVPKYMFNIFKKRLNNKAIKITQANITTTQWLSTQNPQGDRQQVLVNIPYGDQILNNISVGEYDVVIDSAEHNPLAVSVRSAQKREIIQNIIVPIFGANAAQVIDWDWLFNNSDLGDMSKQLDKIKQVLGQMSEQGAEAAAMNKMNALLDTVKKNVDLTDTGKEVPAYNNQAETRKSPAKMAEAS